MTSPVLPDANRAYPFILSDGTEHTDTVLLRHVIAHPRFVVGDHSYASDFDPPADWAARLAPYLFPCSQEKLRIGRFARSRRVCGSKQVRPATRKTA